MEKEVRKITVFRYLKECIIEEEFSFFCLHGRAELKPPKSGSYSVTQAGWSTVVQSQFPAP